MTTQPHKRLETFPNPKPARDFLISIRLPEFTCLCPVTGQPDFAEMTLDYIADQTCVELKSLKLYIWSFRNEGMFHEAVTNAIKTSHKIGEKGHEARVLIQGIDNRLHVEWVYGKSPDPPPD